MILNQICLAKLYTSSAHRGSQNVSFSGHKIERLRFLCLDNKKMRFSRFSIRISQFSAELYDSIKIGVYSMFPLGLLFDILFVDDRNVLTIFNYVSS